MMSDNKDKQAATTSKEIREEGNGADAEMDEVMNAVDEEMRNTKNNPEEEEELMVSLDSRSFHFQYLVICFPLLLILILSLHPDIGRRKVSDLLIL
jgi:hypothetical protein